MGVRSALHDARWVIAFALVAFGANLWIAQLRGDPIVYAAVSQNIVQSGDWMQLTLNDEPYLNKPPLYFWLTATTMTLFGTGAVGAKLGALLASTALCVLLYRGVRHIFDDRAVGMLAVFVFAGTYVVYRNTYHARMESLVTLFVLASVLAFLRWLESGRPAWAVLWGAMAGLGVLTKGPVGMLPILAGIVWLVLRERDRLAPRFLVHVLAGLGAGLLVCGWWFFSASRGGDFISTFFGEQILDRSILGTPQAAHRWWSVYWAKLLSVDLIWMAAAVVGARRAWKHETLRRPVGLFLCTAAVHLVMIHLVEEKTARYLYQLYVFTAGLSAYGILSVRRFDAEHLLKIALVLVAIGLQFTGTNPSRNWFAPIVRAQELSRISGWPVVTDWRQFEALDEQAALDYYLDRTVPPDPMPTSYLLIQPSGMQMPDGHPLMESARVTVGLVIEGVTGPGPAMPMTSTPETSP